LSKTINELEEKEMNNLINNLINKYTSLLARVLISAIFLMAGASKITAYEGTQGYMDMMGVPSFLLPLVIITELLGGVAILIGYKTRIVALLLAGFSLLSALLFHFDFADQMQSIMFMKNLAIAGGFLLLVNYGAGYFSVDNGLPQGKSQ